VAKDSGILTAAVNRSGPNIHGSPFLVLSQIRQLSQAGGMHCAQERLLGGCDL